MESGGRVGLLHGTGLKSPQTGWCRVLGLEELALFHWLDTAAVRLGGVGLLHWFDITPWNQAKRVGLFQGLNRRASLYWRLIKGLHRPSPAPTWGCGVL